MSDFEIPILSTFVGFLADIMRVCLEFCYQITDDLGFPSYGVAIIVLTVIIKTLLLPLALKQIRSMKAMQEIQPEMQRIQKKYKNDPKMLREEMQKLYRENNANPMAGCLPLLVQMPFLVSIYYALQGFSYDPAHESFLWLQSLAVPDETYVLPLLAALSTFVISWQTTPKDAPSNQKTMLIVMPLMIGWMSLNFPSGLVIYWTVCNVYQLVQQTIMYRGEMKERLLGSRKKGTVTVHGGVQQQIINEEKKKKKIVRKKIVRKVVKKKPEENAENAEAAPEKEAPKAAAPKAEAEDHKEEGKTEPARIAEEAAKEAVPETAEPAEKSSEKENISTGEAEKK